MKWRGRRGSANVEDRRADGGRTGFGRGAGGGPGGGLGGGFGGGFGAPRGGRRPPFGLPPGAGGGRGIPLPRSRAGLVLLLVVLALGWFLGGEEGAFGPATGPAPAPGAAPGRLTEAEREAGAFVSVVLADTEEVWAEVFRDELGRAYDPPTLVLFSGATFSACGPATAATGPFYCPRDRKVYLDTDFFATLRAELGADGDFAQAYVIAHEVGHHVQGELGLLAETARLRATLPAAEANAVSVRTELMADCLAGLWARRAEEMLGVLEPGDVEEAMTAAARIGDDALQRRAGGVVRPDSFTHGTSEQRTRWFDVGFREGRVAACDTFAAERL